MERLKAKDEETKKELQITLTNYEKLTQKLQEQEELAKEHKERITSHVVEHEELQNEIAALK